MRALPIALLASLMLTACPKEGDTGAFIDADGDGYGEWEDCNDRDPMIHPDAMETCDGRDNDCDDEIDEGATVTLYLDADGDSYGDASTETTGCAGTGGYSEDGTDCDDANAEVHPDAEEWCDGLDNDCDDEVDEDIEYADWYADEDADGYGDPDNAVTACVQPSGYLEDSQDCDDSDPEINPEADEYCDGVDNDCDGGTDEADALDTLTWYPDADSDGFGDASAEGTVRCDAGSDETLDNSDCDDSDADVNPDGTEVCDDGGADEDCDGLVDDDDDSTDASTMSTWQPDVDLDGYGDMYSSTDACDQPTGWTDDATDCDDSDGAINRGAVEICDGVDNDCDGAVDDDDFGVTGTSTWYVDADGDGWGSSRGSVEACDQPTGYVDNADDCDDTDASLTDDCPEDTGEAFTRDGTYEGDFEIYVEIPLMGVTDTCSGTAIIDVEEAAATQISGRGTCAFAGVLASLMGSQTGLLEGEITSDPDAEGTVSVGTIITDDWEGAFSDDDTLYGEFDGNITYLTYSVDYVAAFEVVR
jgi:hypothetical protein